MVVKMANKKIRASHLPSKAAIPEPIIIPETDKGRVLNLIASIQNLIFDIF